MDKQANQMWRKQKSWGAGGIPKEDLCSDIASESIIVFVSCSINKNNFAVDCYNRVFNCPVAMSDCSIKLLDCSIRVFRSF